MSKLEVVTLSNIGKKRETNQDNFYCNGIFKPMQDTCFFNRQVEDSQGEKIYAVLDGMGGLRYGEQAAYIGVETLHSYIQKSRTDKNTFSGGRAVYHMNEAICAEIKNKHARMGSTVTLLKYDHAHIRFYNLGDSKAFLYRKGTLRQMTEDHTEQASYLRLQKNLGIKSVAYQENALTQYLGIESEEFVIEPSVSSEIKMMEKDIFLLCTDGLTDMVQKEKISAVLSENTTLEEKGRSLEKLAMDAGGRDNITILLLEKQV